MPWNYLSGETDDGPDPFGNGGLAVSMLPVPVSNAAVPAGPVYSPPVQYVPAADPVGAVLYTTGPAPAPATSAQAAEIAAIVAQRAAAVSAGPYPQPAVRPRGLPAGAYWDPAQGAWTGGNDSYIPANSYGPPPDSLLATLGGPDTAAAMAFANAPDNPPAKPAPADKPAPVNDPGVPLYPEEDSQFTADAAYHATPSGDTGAAPADTADNALAADLPVFTSNPDTFDFSASWDFYGADSAPAPVDNSFAVPAAVPPAFDSGPSPFDWWAFLSPADVTPADVAPDASPDVAPVIPQPADLPTFAAPSSPFAGIGSTPAFDLAAPGGVISPDMPAAPTPAPANFSRGLFGGGGGYVSNVISEDYFDSPAFNNAPAAPPPAQPPADLPADLPTFAAPSSPFAGIGSTPAFDLAAPGGVITPDVPSVAPAPINFATGFFWGSAFVPFNAEPDAFADLGAYLDPMNALADPAFDNAPDGTAAAVPAELPAFASPADAFTTPAAPGGVIAPDSGPIPLSAPSFTLPDNIPAPLPSFNTQPAMNEDDYFFDPYSDFYDPSAFDTPATDTPANMVGDINMDTPAIDDGGPATPDFYNTPAVDDGTTLSGGVSGLPDGTGTGLPSQNAWEDLGNGTYLDYVTGGVYDNATGKLVSTDNGDGTYTNVDSNTNVNLDGTPAAGSSFADLLNGIFGGAAKAAGGAALGGGGSGITFGPAAKAATPAGTIPATGTPSTGASGTALVRNQTPAAVAGLSQTQMLWLGLAAVGLFVISRTK